MDISLDFEILGELDFLSRRVINQWNYNLNSCLGLQPLWKVNQESNYLKYFFFQKFNERMISHWVIVSTHFE